MNFSLSDLSKNAQDTNETRTKVLILGSGPAGLAAALYAARAELQPVVLAGMELGGQAALTHIIENYPGFPEGVGGAKLGELFQQQAERFGATVEFETATAVNLATRPFKISTYGQEFIADTLIIATGASPNHLNIPGEKEFTGKGVSYCATCDGWFFKDKKVVVVGGGDSALEEALFLTRFASRVTIIHRRDSLRAGAILQRRAKENGKIDFIWNTAVTSVNGTDAVKSITVKNVVNGTSDLVETDGVFIFIGHTPNTSLFTGQIEMDDRGYIKTNLSLATNVPGVFAAGEVMDSTYRQVVTSAGMGAGAAIQATRFLEHEN